MKSFTRGLISLFVYELRIRFELRLTEGEIVSSGNLEGEVGPGEHAEVEFLPWC